MAAMFPLTSIARLLHSSRLKSFSTSNITSFAECGNREALSACIAEEWDDRFHGDLIEQDVFARLILDHSFPS